MIATIVTEAEWDAPIGPRRGTAPRATRSARSRTAHADVNCAQAKGLPVVARDVDVSTREAGFPCSYCIVDLSEYVDPVPARVQDDYHDSTDPDARVHAHGHPDHTAAADAPTPKQVDFWRGLFIECMELRDGPGDYFRASEAAADRMAAAGEWTRAGLSAAITRGKEAVKPLRDKARTAPATGPGVWPDVPAGHYAVESAGSNDLLFVRVDLPTEGDHAGRTFVKMIVGGKPDRNVPRAQVAGILTRIIDAGIEDAARRYGREIGQCCRCNRRLTDEESRRLGIGPECRKR